MNRISRISDIEKVNKIVRRGGYQPFTEEGSYYLAALQFKKTILMNEKLDAFMSRSHALNDVKPQKNFPDPVLKSMPDVESFGKWKKMDLKLCLMMQGGSTLEEVTKRFMLRLADERLLCQFNRTGSDGRVKFKGEIEDFIKEAVAEYCLNSEICFDAKKVETKIASVLKVASDKHSKKKYVRSIRRNDRVTL